MKRPAEPLSGTPGHDWYDYHDAITAIAQTGHRLTINWDCGIATVPITETGDYGDYLSFHPCQPRWVATWNVEPNHGINDPVIVADADPRLLTVADGPALHADSHEVGAWIALVISAVAGHRPASDHNQYRDFAADGYTTFPNQ